MADSVIVLSINILVIITFFILYGLKWAFLIGITILFWIIYLSASNSYGSRNAVQIDSDERVDKEVYGDSDIDLLYTENSDPGMECSGYRTRLVKNIVRRNPTLTQEPCNDVQIYRNRKPGRDRHMSTLRSPEPLLSQVTKHLSFNNTSYYNSDKMRHSLSSNDETFLSTSTSSRWYNIPDISIKQQPFMIDQSSSLLQERYSNRKFNILSPSTIDKHSTSTVKIGRPNESDSRFALESILHKRLERTKHNPCCRQSVLSALGQKNRKRSAYDSDCSVVEPYSAKKRRRDELDDFLDVVNNPLSSPSTTYAGVKSMKRSYSDSISEKPSSESTRKKTKEKTTNNDWTPSLALPHSGSGCTFEDSGVDMNSPNKVLPENALVEAKVVQPAKLRKRKSVTFSEKLVNEGESKKNSQLTSEDGKTEDTNKLNDDSRDDNALVFPIGFSPRKSPPSEYLASVTNRSERRKLSPRRHRSSNITWKDLQENRREAWRRSQKLLDEIEESLANEKLHTASSVEPTNLSAPVTSSLASTMTSLPISSVSSVTNVQTTPEQVPSATATGQLTNFIGVVSSNAKSTNTLLVHTGSKTVQSILSGGSTETTSGFTFGAPKSPLRSSSITGSISGTLSTPAVSSSVPSLLSTGNTSSKANTASQPSFSFHSSVVSSGSTSQVARTPSSTFTFQTSTGGLSTGSVSQAAVSVVQNTTPGLFYAGSLVGSPVQNASNLGVSISSAAPKSGGFSFSATAVTTPTPTSSFSVNAPAAQNVSGGFAFKTAQENTGAAKTFAFTASSSQKPNTIGGFTFNAPTTNKPNTGFTFSSPINNKGSDTGGEFQLNNNSAFMFDNNANVSSGFTFNTNTNKPANSSGFKNNPPTFNFGAPPGGFHFASSTPIPTNSARVSNNVARTRQRRRPKR